MRQIPLPAVGLGPEVFIAPPLQQRRPMTTPRQQPDAIISVLYDEKDARWRVLVEHRDGCAEAVEDQDLRKAMDAASERITEHYR